MNAFGRHMGAYTEDSSKMGWLVSILELGAWLGTLYSGFLAEIFSRKYAILVNTGIFILGVVIQSTAITSAGHNSILAGRFITGMLCQLSRSSDRKLTRRRHGGRFVVHDCAHVQRRMCAARNPRCHGRHATDGYHYWYHDRFLDRLRQVPNEVACEQPTKANILGVGTNYIGGSGEGQSDAAWLVPLCLQLFPAAILGIGMIFMVNSPGGQIFTARTHICNSLSRLDGLFTTTARPMPARHSPACATCRQTTT